MFRFNLNFVVLTVLISVISAEFPSDVKRCKSADSDCQKIVLQEIVQKFHRKGHRILNLIPFDPLTVKSLVLPKVAGSPVNIELKFKDITLSGISKAIINKVSGLLEDGPDKFLYEVDVDFPEIVLDGPYSVDGQVLVLPITGQGKSKIIFENVSAKIKGKSSVVEKGGKKHYNIDKIHLDLQPKKTIFALENLFNGDKTLGDNMNKFLNDNWSEVYGELKPVIVEAIGKILLQIANGVFSTIDKSELFLEP